MLSLVVSALLSQAPAAVPSDAPTRANAPKVRVLTLQEAVKTALELQPIIREQRANTEAAQARAGEARAGFLPQVNAGANYVVSVSNAGGPTGTGPGTTGNTGGVGFGFTGFTANANVSQLIWDFGQTWGRYQAARSNAKAQEQGELAQRLTVILNTEVAYFNARANKDLVKVAQDTLSNSTLHLQQIRGFVEVGTRADIDLAQARTDEANARVQLIRTQNGYETSKAQLNQAIGIEGPTDYDVGDEALPPTPVEEASLDTLLAEALEARPEFAQLEAQVEAQQHSITAATGAYFPTIAAQGNATARTPDFSTVPWNVSGQLTLNWDIFNGLLTTNQVREQKAALEFVTAQRDAVRQSVRLEVDTARLNLAGAKAADLAANEALINARDRLKLAEGRYQTGVGSVIELSDAQLALTNAAAQKVQAEYAVSTARAQLLKSIGRTAE